MTTTTPTMAPIGDDACEISSERVRSDIRIAKIKLNKKKKRFDILRPRPFRVLGKGKGPFGNPSTLLGLVALLHLHCTARITKAGAQCVSHGVSYIIAAHRGPEIARRRLTKIPPFPLLVRARQTSVCAAGRIASSHPQSRASNLSLASSSTF